MTQIFADRLAFRKLDLVEERVARWKTCTNHHKQRGQHRIKQWKAAQLVSVHGLKYRHRRRTT